MPGLSSINSSKVLFENLIWTCEPTGKESKVDKNSNDDDANKECEFLNRNAKLMRRQMSSIGRFSLRSQTKANPSIITFFVALAHDEGKDISEEEFISLWEQRVMKKYERFTFQVCGEDDRYFEKSKKPIEKYVLNVGHPEKNGGEFVKRIESMLLSPFDVTRGLWEAQLSSGVLGDSGALSREQIQNHTILHNRETLALFRVHHSLCDGVSLSVAIGELADESEKLKERIRQEVDKRKLRKKQRSSIILAPLNCLMLVFWYLISSTITLLVQLWRVAVASSPFDEILATSQLPPGSHSIAWRDLDSLNHAKTCSKNISPSTTVNDLAVHLVTYAIKRQLDEHRRTLSKTNNSQNLDQVNVNIVIPVHLNGGIVMGGKDLGNKIGAFVATVPLPKTDDDTISRAKEISHILKRGKSSPAPLISWLLAKFSSDYAPLSWTKFLMRKFNAKSVAVVSNVKGWPFHVHWLGRKVAFLCAFLPLPPGIPIGVVVQSYDSNISFSINADKRVVPDANVFADWMMEEYHRIKQTKGKVQCK